MGIRCSIDATARIVRLEVSGDVTPDEWTAAMRAVLKHPEYRPGFGFLSDRRAAPPASVSFVENALGFVMVKQKALAGAHYAVVVSDPAAVEMARMGAAGARSACLPILVEIFPDPEQAERWLRVAPTS